MPAGQHAPQRSQVLGPGDQEMKANNFDFGASTLRLTPRRAPPLELTAPVRWHVAAVACPRGSQAARARVLRASRRSRRDHDAPHGPRHDRRKRPQSWQRCRTIISTSRLYATHPVPLSRKLARCVPTTMSSADSGASPAADAAAAPSIAERTTRPTAGDYLHPTCSAPSSSGRCSIGCTGAAILVSGPDTPMRAGASSRLTCRLRRGASRAYRAPT